jgi:flagellar basal-body rod protein FlgC
MHIVIINEAQKELVNNFILYKKYNTKIIDNGSYITLERINEKILIDIIYMLNLKMEVIKDNIININTTRTPLGGAYIRKYLIITAENGIEILQDTSSKLEYYDPTHPDAIREGENEGYVQYPIIDFDLEYYDLLETVQLYNGIVEYINNNYKEIAVTKANMMTFDEIEHNNKIENMFKLLLEFTFEEKYKTRIK